MEDEQKKSEQQPPVVIEHEHAEVRITADPPKVLRGILLRPPTADLGAK